MPLLQKSLIPSLLPLYPDPRSELNFSNEYQLVTAVILSAQCTDKKVNQVTPRLFERFPSFADLSKAPLTEVEEIIRPVNYFRTKAKNLISMALEVSRSHRGKLPTSREALMELPGIGRKTANVVLCEQGEFPALPVDTHVFRLAHRLGFSKGKTPDDVEADLGNLYPPKDWRTLHHLLILHGRRICKAQRPDCGACPLAGGCPQIGVQQVSTESTTALKRAAKNRDQGPSKPRARAERQAPKAAARLAGRRSRR